MAESKTDKSKASASESKPGGGKAQQPQAQPPGREIDLRLKHDATIGNGRRKAGTVLGRITCEKGTDPGQVAALSAIRLATSVEAQGDPKSGIKATVTMAKDLAGWKAGDLLATIDAKPGVNLPEIRTALANPRLIGL